MIKKIVMTFSRMANIIGRTKQISQAILAQTQTSYLYLPEPIDGIEENAFIISNDVEPFSEERTKLTNFFIYNGVLFAIDSCYIGDSRTEEEEGDWETLVCFANPEGYAMMDVLVKWYDDPISMIEGHLEILKNPETMFEGI